MSRSSFGLGALAVLIVAWLVATGCGSTDDPSSSSGSPRSSGDAPPAAPDPSAASSPDTAPVDRGSSIFLLTSLAFSDGDPIPVRYACANLGGEAASPPLTWEGVPAGATTLVLVVHDPDAPVPGGFTHLVARFPVDTTGVDDGANERADSPMASWVGPCPPSGQHRYTFTLYAFGDDVEIPTNPTKAAIDAVATQALATSELTGVFDKEN